MYKVRTFNQIALRGLERFSRDGFAVGTEISDPHAILLRSHVLTTDHVTPSLRAVARAGAGVNNVPVDAYTERGIVVFNTPDANVMSKTILSKASVAKDGSGLPVPLSFNNNLNAWGTFLKVSAFSDASRVLYATYGYGSFSEADGQAYVAIPPPPARQPIYYLSDRKALMMFLDGHAEPVSPPMPSRMFK